MFTEPSRIRNCSLFNFPMISEPMIAAWLESIPGKKEQIGEIKIVARVGFIISFLSMSNFPTSCFGITVFDFMELIIVDVPKSPVRSGRSGCWMFRFSVTVRGILKVEILLWPLFWILFRCKLGR